MEQEFERLRALYAAMADEELLKLGGAKGELTEAAERAVEAEVAARGLELESTETVQAAAMPELAASEDDPALVELMTFQIAGDAARALKELDEAGVPVRMEPAMRRMVEGGPKVKTNWLTIFVEHARQQDAVVVLRERMGLFPVVEAEHSHGTGEYEDGDEGMFAVGDFDLEADAELARQALMTAGIFFRETQIVEPEGTVTVIEARLDDVEQALAVVEAAFVEG